MDRLNELSPYLFLKENRYNYMGIQMIAHLFKTAPNSKAILSATIDNTTVNFFLNNIYPKFTKEEFHIIDMYVGDSDYFNNYIRFGTVNLMNFQLLRAIDKRFISLTDKYGELIPISDNKIPDLTEQLDKHLIEEITLIKKRVSILTKMLKKYSVKIKKDIILFRVVSKDREIISDEEKTKKKYLKTEKYFEDIINLKKGDIYEHKDGDFLSFATDPRYSWNFVYGNCCLFRITVPKGTPIFLVLSNSGSIQSVWSEVIFHKPTYKITGTEDYHYIKYANNTFQKIKIIDAKII